MLKNLRVNSENKIRADKKHIHRICGLIKNELQISFESLTINFVLPVTIEDINVRYLNHEGTTDIITFNYSGDNVNIDGEIFISVEDAKANAERFGCSMQSELLRLIIHGLLHLKGYDDMQEDDYKLMKSEEDRLTRKYDYLTENLLLSYEHQNC